ncbi:MAG: hypothetical protein IE909_01625 [Campylobacterales bacterium]|nr:hypothetical protein [Campylobacterales bacterium]
MPTDLSQLDELIESDVLKALGQDIQDESDNHDLEKHFEMVTETDLLKNVPEGLLEIEVDNEKGDSLEELGDFNDNIIQTPTPSIDELEQDLAEDENVIDDIGDIEILPLAEIESAIKQQQEEEVINARSGDLAALLSQLLKNKTIEITIKVKD